MNRFKRRDTQTEHQYVEERLSTYLDGELLPQEQSIVERHLATCRSCQWDLSTMRKTVQWARELPTMPVPRAFTIPAPAQPRRASRRRWTFLPLLQGATALVALLLVFVVAGDVWLTGLPTLLAPQSGAVREQAPAAAEATQVAEAVQVEQVLEVEVVVEKEVAAPVEAPAAALIEAPEPPAALPTEAAAAEPALVGTATLAADAAPAGEGATAEEAKVAEMPSTPTVEATQWQTYAPTPQIQLTQTLALSSAPRVTGVITPAVSVEMQPTPVPEPILPPVEPTAVAQDEETPTAAPTPEPVQTSAGGEEAGVQTEPAPTEIVFVPSTEEPPAALPPTAQDRAEEPRGPIPEELDRPTPPPVVPAVARLRLAEGVLATTFVLLGLTTIVAMLLQRKPR